MKLTELIEILQKYKEINPNYLVVINCDDMYPILLHTAEIVNTDTEFFEFWGKEDIVLLS